MKILLTGYTGLVGSEVLRQIGDKAEVVELGRKKSSGFSGQFFEVDLLRGAFPKDAFVGVDVVIHCAAKVHDMDNQNHDDYFSINTKATIELARLAANSGVKRFIYLSTVKVNGEQTSVARRFSENSPHETSEPYGASKAEAENQLREVALKSNIEVVIIRPPLVYGPNVKSNFYSLMKIISSGIPIPLGAFVHNKRSLVYVKNLADLVCLCIDHPGAANQTFMVSDDYDLSTYELIDKLTVALNKSNRCFRMPRSALKLGLSLINKKSVYDRLNESLQVDISHTKNMLGWTPPYTLEKAFHETAVGYLNDD